MDLTIIPGTSPTFRFEITDPDPACGDAFDLTDYQVFFFLKRSLQDHDNASEFFGTIDDGITVTYERRDGVVDVVIPSQATANLRIGRPYPFFLKVSLVADPTQVFIPIRGEFVPVLPGDE